jgi:GNAT superfamily N-acetyltransferase
MTVADILFGMGLKARAGWNQLEADWRRLLDVQPGGGFVAELDARAVGTVMTCRFGPVAWIAMMLVDEQFRGRGFGRALMVRALSALDEAGVASVRLDATPLGRPLYESLGFVAETDFTRFQGTLQGADDAPRLPEVEPAVVLDAVAALDRAVTGTDRHRLLRRLAQAHPESLRVVTSAGTMRGFLMSRPGALARQLGPCIAFEDAGPLLFADARRRYDGEPVFIDIPATNAAAASLVQDLGLTAGRHLTRMGRGPRIHEDLDRLWASAGPEKG